jgi:hypothetical protein
MANLYFCQPGVRSHFALRAVLSRAESIQMLSSHESTFLGASMPTHTDMDQGGGDSAVLLMHEDDAGADWRPGCYKVHTPIGDLNSKLLALSK